MTRAPRVPLLALVVATLGNAGTADATWVVEPRVGADFEHFGETYRVTADQDTVMLIDDYGTSAGILLRTGGSAERRVEVEAEAYTGHSTRRARGRLEARWRGAKDRWELRQEASYRVTTDAGDTSLSADHLDERFGAAWERRLGGPWSVRLKDSFDGTWYREPDPYNLTSWTHEPNAEVRYDFGQWSRLHAGYRLARRDVPDSTTLGFDRHGVEAGLSWLAGAATSLDVTETLQRRVYDSASVRESSWENRVEVRLELSPGDAATYRVLHENEAVRFDRPDDLDFNSNWARTGLQLELHRTSSLDLSLMPVYAFLSGATSAEEEYTELGVELGVDWRFGRGGWIGVTNEVGRRDYRIDAPAEEVDLTSDLAVDASASTAFSDYTYDRLTLILGAEPFPGIAANLFVHWQPEAHAVSRHDTETRIVSGGLSYSF